MSDFEDTIIVCGKCRKEAHKTILDKGGYKLRGWVCPKCHKKWTHPKDQAEYARFKEIKEKEFNVKLRMVGNSYAVSIPREIIDFQHVTKTENVRMLMKEPGKITLSFFRTKKFIKKK